MVEFFCLLFQHAVLFLDIDILFFDHHFQLHFVLEPADRIADNLSDDIGLIRLYDIADNAVLVAFSLDIVGIFTCDHDERDSV